MDDVKFVFDCDESECETAFILDCCGIEVGDWYRYCPRCGKKIDLEKVKKTRVPPVNPLDLFDYITWFCTCGKGYERIGYEYCPICGKRQTEDPDDTLEFDKIEKPGK